MTRNAYTMTPTAYATGADPDALYPTIRVQLAEPTRDVEPALRAVARRIGARASELGHRVFLGESGNRIVSLYAWRWTDDHTDRETAERRAAAMLAPAVDAAPAPVGGHRFTVTVETTGEAPTVDDVESALSFAYGWTVTAVRG